MNLTASSCTTRYMFSSFFKHMIISTAIRKLQKTRIRDPVFLYQKNPCKNGDQLTSPPQPPNSLSIPTSNARSAMIRHGWTLKQQTPSNLSNPRLLSSHLSGPDCPDGIGSITQNTGFDPQVFFWLDSSKQAQPSFCQPRRKKTAKLVLGIFPCNSWQEMLQGCPNSRDS